LIVLDHNIPKNQAEQLTRSRLHWKQIGYQVGRPEWDDRQEIQRYLQANRRTTFFTRDSGFFNTELCHDQYCIVVMGGPIAETAAWIRRFLKCPEFRTVIRRSGKVVMLGSSGIAVLEKPQERRYTVRW
jgi:hypothetical protein